jgi:hypothetical protein
VAERRWATTNRTAVQAFRAGLDEGIAYAKANDKSARESIMKHLKLAPEVAAGMPFPPVMEVEIAPEQIDFWLRIAKDQNLLPPSTKLTAQNLLFQ